MIQFPVSARGPVEATVFDVAGRKVRTLMIETAVAPGLRSIEWDRRDDAGHLMSAGLYLVWVRTSSTSGSRKVTVID
jgi:flagellar hook assembly protein FlgD